MTGASLKRKLLSLDKSLAEIARKLNVSQQSLNQTLNAADIKSGFIECVAQVYRRPISYFFEDEKIEIREAGRDYVERGKIENNGILEHINELNAKDSEIALLKERNSALESLLAEKERTIQILLKK